MNAPQAEVTIAIRVTLQNGDDYDELEQHISKALPRLERGWNESTPLRAQTRHFHAQIVSVGDRKQPPCCPWESQTS